MTATAPMIDDVVAMHAPTAQISVLIVDDDRDSAEELSECLETFGFNCFMAASPDEAMKVAGEQPEITAIVTDFYLRGVRAVAENGLHLLDRLRVAHPDRLFDCLVISGDPDILAECALDGAVKFLPKPVVAESLIAMLLSPPCAVKDTEEDHVSLALMHRLLESQSNAIATLTEALNANQVTRDRDARQALNRLDLLVDAAKIANKRVEGTAADEIRTLLAYIAGQGDAVKGLLSDTGSQAPPNVA